MPKADHLPPYTIENIDHCQDSKIIPLPTLYRLSTLVRKAQSLWLSGRGILTVQFVNCVLCEVGNILGVVVAQVQVADGTSFRLSKVMHIRCFSGCKTVLEPLPVSSTG